ncbi:Odorant receptor [Operophtera brumata]|uniref:Odorant receptor n=1 Tax=Operophtera brumata TaxID=104452 RepID=A0A0L7LDP2_OPEBR|nr:Odorant receptor [Operophtera brumata]
MWYKRHKFRQLVGELADIWPVSTKDEQEAGIKQDMYTFWNAIGVWFYNLTPIAILIYHRARGVPSQLGYVYQLSYPFDKTKPIYHEIAYVFESCAGKVIAFKPVVHVPVTGMPSTTGQIFDALYCYH